MKNVNNNDTLLDALDYGCLIIDNTFKIISWNRWLSVTTQITKDDIEGRNLQEYYPHLNYKTLLRKISTSLDLNTSTFYDSSNKTILFPIKRHKVSKTSISLMQQQITISPYNTDLSQVLISIHDISDLFDAKNSLKIEIDKVNNLNRYLEEEKKIVDKNVMLVKTDLNAIIIEVSSLFCEFFEYEKSYLIGKNTSIFRSKNIPINIYANLWSTILNKKTWFGEIENITSSGEKKWVDVRVIPICDADANIIQYHAIYHDIVNKKTLEQLYITDALTKTYNRVYFDELMNNITTYQRKSDTDFVIVIADIDFFKNVNDTYGHQVGDEVLKHTATMIKNSLRENDVVARWGGEEFIIMLKHTTVEEAKSIIEKLRLKIEKEKVDDSISVTISFGLTQYNLGEDTSITFKRADDALYEAKNTGRNKLIVHK